MIYELIKTIILEVLNENQNFKFDDLITIKKNAEVINSVTNKPVPQKIVDDGKLWAVDFYEEESGMLNINRVLDPYPGAYCSWIHEDDVEKLVKRK